MENFFNNTVNVVKYLFIFESAYSHSTAIKYFVSHFIIFFLVFVIMYAAISKNQLQNDQ